MGLTPLLNNLNPFICFYSTTELPINNYIGMVREPSTKKIFKYLLLESKILNWSLWWDSNPHFKDFESFDSAVGLQRDNS